MSQAAPVTCFEFSGHAIEEMQRRGLPETVVAGVLVAPEQRWNLRPGRDVLQARITFGQPPKTYLVRAIVDVKPSPAVVVTAYRTSKLDKYWRLEP